MRLPGESLGQRGPAALQPGVADLDTTGHWALRAQAGAPRGEGRDAGLQANWAAARPRRLRRPQVALWSQGALEERVPSWEVARR